MENEVLEAGEFMVELQGLFQETKSSDANGNATRASLGFDYRTIQLDNIEKIGLEQEQWSGHQE